MKEFEIKPDSSGKNAMLLSVNGSRLRFNKPAVEAIKLEDHVALNLATFSEDEDAQPDKLIIRADHPKVPKRPLSARSTTYRDLYSEEVVRATRMPNKSYPIQYSEDHKVYFVEFDPNAPERTTFDRDIKKREKKEIDPNAPPKVKRTRAGRKEKKEA